MAFIEASSSHLLVIIAFCGLHISLVSSTTFLWNHEGTWQRSVQGTSPVCVDIPSNMSLCHGIGYTKMRLPNLLHHDSLQEVSQQAVSWVPLSQLGCHPDTQLFLCSLFTPVCLDHPIPPCRSLCVSVQTSCEDIMSKYGYPWPTIVRCDQFPVDNDMCIQAQHQDGFPGHGQGSSTPAKGSPAGETPKALEPQKHHFHPEQTGKGGEKRRNKNKKNANRKEKHNREEPSNQPGHHHLQTLPLPSLSQRSQEHQEVEKRPPVVFNPREFENKQKAGGSHQVDERKRLHQEILGKYCSSQWSLKARAFIDKNLDYLVLKLRNYRTLHGTFPENRKNVEILVPLNISHAMVAEDPEAPEAGRRRYYLMGTTRGRQNIATFAIPWPHKMGQFRKALKIVKSGSIDCGSEQASVSTPASPVVPAAASEQMSAIIEEEEEDEAKKEKKKRRKEERRRQRQQLRKGRVTDEPMAAD